MNVRAALRTSAVASVTFSMAASLSVEELTVGTTPERRDRYVKVWARLILRALGVEVSRAGSVPPRNELPRLVVANHRSTLDIPIVLATVGGHLLSRGDMEHWPIAGKFAQMAGTIFVDRSDPQSGATAIRAMRQALEARRVVGVFPEGTTFSGDEVRPFHAGAFMAITRVRGEILPLGLAYDSTDSYFVDEPMSAHYARVAGAHRSRVGLSIGAPFAAKGSIAGLAETARAAVQAEVTRARALLAR